MRQAGTFFFPPPPFKGLWDVKAQSFMRVLGSASAANLHSLKTLIALKLGSELRVWVVRVEIFPVTAPLVSPYKQTQEGL